MKLTQTIIDVKKTLIKAENAFVKQLKEKGVN